MTPDLLIHVIVIIALVGLLVRGLQKLIPGFPAPFLNATYVVSVVGLVLYIIQVFGLLHSFHLGH